MNKFKYNFDFIMTLGMKEIKVHFQSNAKTVALQAPSGSGKSSFIRSILKLHRKVKGHCTLEAQRIGYVPQDSLLIPTLNVRENLLLSPRSKASDLEFIGDALSISPLLDRYPRMLSGGEKQRVSIGRALLSNPDLLILDEPFAALDFEKRTAIAHFLKNWMSEKNVDLILVTHDETSSALMCSEFWTIQDDQIRKLGP